MEELAAKSGGLSLILRTHKVERERERETITQFAKKLTFDLYICATCRLNTQITNTNITKKHNE